MQLFRYRDNDTIKPGVKIGDAHYDLSSLVTDIDRDFFETDQLSKLSQLEPSQLGQPIDQPEFDAPVYRPGKSVCIGLN